MPTTYFLWEYQFLFVLCFNFVSTLSGMQMEHKVKAVCIHLTGGQNTFV